MMKNRSVLHVWQYLVAVGIVAAVLVGLVAPLEVRAQTAPRLRILRVEDSRFPRLDVGVMVTDAQGKPVTGLSAENFAVLEDDQPVSGLQVKETTTSSQPIAVALAVDVSGSMRSSLPTVVEAVTAFLQRLQPEDWVSLVSFSDQVHVEEAWTQNKGAVQAKMAALKTGGNTALYDAVVRALHLLQQRGERKALIVLTDGQDRGSEATLDDVITLAVQAGVPVYPVGFGAVDKKSLGRLAQSTGGMVQIQPDVQTVAGAFETLSDTLRRQYVLSFTSSLPADGKNHTLEVRAHFQGWQLSASSQFRATPGKVAIEMGNVKDGGVVSGTVVLKPTVTSPAPAVKEVKIYLDGALLQELTQAPFEYAWDTAKLPPGEHVLRVVAVDSAQNQGETTLHLTVRPPVEVTWQTPSKEGGVLQGKVTLGVQVDATTPVSQVQFLVDNKPIQTLTGQQQQGNYAIEWDTSTVGAGQHVLAVVVRDAKGHSAKAEMPVQVALQGKSGMLWLAFLVVVAMLAILIPVAVRTRRKRRTALGVQPAVLGSRAAPGVGASSSEAVVLVEMSGVNPGKVWSLESNEMRLGRSRKDNDIPLAGTSASRRQALIRKVGDRYVLYNLSPHNPIRVNGEPVAQQRVLRPSDVIQAGESTLRFEARREA